MTDTDLELEIQTVILSRKQKLEALRKRNAQLDRLNPPTQATGVVVGLGSAILYPGRKVGFG